VNNVYAPRPEIKWNKKSLNSVLNSSTRELKKKGFDTVFLSKKGLSVKTRPRHIFKGQEGVCYVDGYQKAELRLS